MFENAAFKIRPMGSVAYKLAMVSAGIADVTFTLTPKNEWDVVAGAALLQSGGGFVSTLEKVHSNRQSPRPSSVRTAGKRTVPERRADFISGAPDPYD